MSTYYVTTDDVGFPFEKIKIASDGSGHKAGLGVGWIKVAKEGAKWDDPNGMTTFYINKWLAEKEGLTYTKDLSPEVKVDNGNARWSVSGMKARTEINPGMKYDWTYSVTTTENYETINSDSRETNSSTEISVGVGYKSLKGDVDFNAKYGFAQQIKSSVEQKFSVSQTIVGTYQVSLACPADVRGGFYQTVNLRHISPGTVTRGPFKFAVASGDAADQYVRTFYWVDDPKKANIKNDIYPDKQAAEQAVIAFRDDIAMHPEKYLTENWSSSDTTPPKSAKPKLNAGVTVKKLP
ncbi:MAG TPA: hypothetical protein VMC06_14530 [Opitutaceae bacterium]|nr:hypothetical protein [Opitutaceae bacterium]